MRQCAFHIIFGSRQCLQLHDTLDVMSRLLHVLLRLPVERFEHLLELHILLDLRLL